MYNEEGLKEFTERIAPNFNTIKPTGWEEIAEIMQKARYSKHEITEKERGKVYEFISNLREESIKNFKFRLKFKLRFVYFVI